MTEFVGSNLNFGDLILKEEFDYSGKTWRSYLVVPQEHLEDLFRTPQLDFPQISLPGRHVITQKISS
jgi:hypothetical protein